jgi:hypothetical protein
LTREIDVLASAKTLSINGLFGSRAQLKTNYLERVLACVAGRLQPFGADEGVCAKLFYCGVSPR